MYTILHLQREHTARRPNKTPSTLPQPTEVNPCWNGSEDQLLLLATVGEE
jgi:hypothetical protein